MSHLLLCELPKELLILISSYLQPHSLLALATTSHQFYALLRFEFPIVLKLGSEARSSNPLEEWENSVSSLPAVDGISQVNKLIIVQEVATKEPDIPLLQHFFNRLTRINEVRLLCTQKTNERLIKIIAGAAKLPIEELSTVCSLERPLPSLQSLHSLRRLSITLAYHHQHETTNVAEFPSNFHVVAPHLSWLSVSTQTPYTENREDPYLDTLFKNVTLPRLTCFILKHEKSSFSGPLNQWRWTQNELDQVSAFIRRHSRTLTSLTLPPWKLPRNMRPDQGLLNALNCSRVETLTMGRSQAAQLFTTQGPLHCIRRLTLNGADKTLAKGDKETYQFPSLVGLQVLRLVLKHDEQSYFEQLPQLHPEIVELHVNLRKFHSRPPRQISEDVLRAEWGAISHLFDHLEDPTFLAQFQSLRQIRVYLPKYYGTSVARVRRISIERDAEGKIDATIRTLEDWPCSWEDY